MWLPWSIDRRLRTSETQLRSTLQHEVETLWGLVKALEDNVEQQRQIIEIKNHSIASLQEHIKTLRDANADRVGERR